MELGFLFENLKRVKGKKLKKKKKFKGSVIIFFNFSKFHLIKFLINLFLKRCLEDFQ